MITSLPDPRFTEKGAQSAVLASGLWENAVIIEMLEARRLLSSVTLLPTQDAYVRDGTFANTNFGSAADLAVKAAPGGHGFVRNAYFQFNLSGQGTISSAMLKVYGDQSSTASEPSIGISAHAVASNTWTQSGIDFNNAPAITNASVGGTTVSGTANTFYYLNLTSYFEQQQSAGKTKVSLALTGNAATASDADFSSTRGAVAPELLLTTGTPTPTPTNATFGPAGDAYVRDGSFAGTNFGTATDLEVKQASQPGFTRISYLTFNLSGISSSAAIDKATLSLFGSTNDGSSVQVDVAQVPDNTFNQNTITYNNAPPIGNVNASALISGSALTQYNFDLTLFARQVISAGQSDLTVAIVGDSVTTADAAFNSTNAIGDAPALEVTYQ